VISGRDDVIYVHLTCGLVISTTYMNLSVYRSHSCSALRTLQTRSIIQSKQIVN